MVVGVTEGFKKELEINGIGCRAAKQGKQVVLNVGFSHQVFVDEIEGITLDVPQPNQIVVSGCDKQKVGQLPLRSVPSCPPRALQGQGHQVC